MLQRVHRYRSLLALTAVLIAAGIGARSRILLVAGIVPLLFVLQGALATGSPLEDRIEVERELRPETPLPGQPVHVTVTLTNISSSTIPDLRVVDGVPAELGIADGKPRASGILRAGHELTVTYSLATNRGTYEFDPVQVRARNLSGTIVAESKLTPDGQISFESRVATDDVPIARQTMTFTGPLATETGGPGVEFYATREYRAGDPIKRINWNHYAKTGDLSTIEYREQRAARITIVIDSRQPAHVSSQPSVPTGATLCAYAASLTVGVLLEDGHSVALAALGVDDPLRSGQPPAWTSVDEGVTFAERAAMICNAAATGTDETVADTTALAADGGAFNHHRLLSRLSADAQVLFCTPALDDEVVSIAEAVRAQGHELTVLSPQITNTDIGGRISSLSRADRLLEMRTLGGSVVDWERDEQLPTALARTLRGVAR